MCGMPPGPSVGHLGDIRLGQRQKNPLLQCVPRRSDSGEVVGMIPGDSMRHDEVQRQEHAGAQFGGVDVVEVHAVILDARLSAHVAVGCGVLVQSWCGRCHESEVVGASIPCADALKMCAHENHTDRRSPCPRLL